MSMILFKYYCWWLYDLSEKLRILQRSYPLPRNSIFFGIYPKKVLKIKVSYTVCHVNYNKKKRDATSVHESINCYVHHGTSIWWDSSQWLKTMLGAGAHDSVREKSWRTQIYNIIQLCKKYVTIKMKICQILRNFSLRHGIMDDCYFLYMF